MTAKPSEATVLIVDDQPEIRKAIRHVLDNDGRFATAEAGDGEEALELLTSRPPDALLLDISMPGVNGIAALPGIREAAPSTKIIVFSSHMGMEEEILRMGVDAFLPKTSTPKKILATLAQVLALP